MKVHTVEELAKLPPNRLLTGVDESAYRCKPMAGEPYARCVLANIVLDLDYRKAACYPRTK